MKKKNHTGGVHVEVIQVTRWTSAVNLSYDRIDFIHVRYNCWRHMKIMLPFPVSSFRTNWIPRSSGRNKFLHHFFLANAPGFRFRKNHMIPDLWLLRQVSLLLCPSTSQVFNFFFPLHQVSLKLWVSPGTLMKTGSLPSALILPQFFPLLVVPASSSPSFWGS